MVKIPRLLSTGWWPGLLSALLLTGALQLGCSKKDWIPEEKQAVYKAEVVNLPSREAIYIKKLNESPWTNVTFIINKDYIFSITEVEEGQKELVIKYEGFKHKNTEEPMPPDVEIWRIWIEGDEGYWY
jgi:hypothetical protein